MNNFQSQLDDELERRGLKEKSAEEDKLEQGEEPEKEKIKKANDNTPKKSIPFSFKAFLTALLLGLAIFIVIFIWLAVSAEKTAEKFIAGLPTKTAIVNREVSPAITTEDIQPVLRMGPMRDEDMTLSEPPPNVVAPVNVPQSDEDFAAAAIPGLYESTNLGPLPIINKETGMTPFKAYQKSVTLDSGKPSIAFILTDMGINSEKTEKLIAELPGSVSLAFSPYAWNAKSLMMTASQDDHETWLTLPLQTKNYPLQDPGPLAILNSANIKQNQERLNTVMGKTAGYAGLISEKEHIFRSENVRTNPVFKEIFERGLAVIDSNDKAINFVRQLAEKEGYPYAQNNFWLDDDLRPLVLNQKLRQALEKSRNSGQAIVMLKPYPASINTLQKFLKSAAAKEFNIVPASALVKSE